MVVDKGLKAKLIRYGLPWGLVHVMDRSLKDVGKELPEPPVAVVRRYLENFPEIERAGGGIAFYGKAGRGKTGLASWLFCQLIKMQLTGIWISESKLIHVVKYREEYESSFEESLWYDKLTTCKVLLIDDMRIIDPATISVIREREGYKGITFITTRKELPDLIEKMDDLAPLKAMCYVLKMDGKDLRNSKSMKLRGMVNA